MTAKRNKRVARVLSIAGDGPRTILAAHILAELEQRTGQPLHKMFHLIVGEGAGAVLALLVSLRSTGGRGLPLGAEAAAIAMEEGLPGAQKSTHPWWRRFAGPSARENQVRLLDAKLTGAEGLLGGADLSSSLTDLAVPVFDMAHSRPFLFRSWKAQGLYLQQGETSGRFEFRGHDIARAALRHPNEKQQEQDATVRARSRVEFQLAGGGAAASDPVGLAVLQARFLYRRADMLQVVSLSANKVQNGTVPRPENASQRWLSQVTAKGMAEQVLTLGLPALDAHLGAETEDLQKASRLQAAAFLAQEESNGFRALAEEYGANRPSPHTTLRTPVGFTSLPGRVENQRRGFASL